jgi:hypothetical protein
VAGLVLGREGSFYMPPQNPSGPSKLQCTMGSMGRYNQQRKPDLTAQMVPTLVARESRCRGVAWFRVASIS